MMELILNIDSSILLFFQELRTPILTILFSIITRLGNAGIFWIAITIILLSPKKTRKVGYMSMFALLLSLLVNNMILKNLVGRIRPYEVIEQLELIIAKPRDLSFPSGHAGASFASASVLYRKLPKKFGIPAVILATLIAISRIYLGVHYPSDVIFGAFSGIVLSYLAQWLVDMMYGRREHRKNKVL